ncbi:MAG: hypothetical protein GX608_10645 [Lentisphaerae bacterium]|nr:hypothetical protein [Lentisphaerota bacterium]
MGFFRESKKKPGTINQALNHRERVEAEKAAQSPEWARVKQRLAELCGPEGQHLVERQRLQERFESDMRKLREKQAAEKSELLQRVGALDPEAAAQAAIQQERFEKNCEVFGKRFVALMRILDAYIASNEITEREAQDGFWRCMDCRGFVELISSMENYRVAPIP